VDDGGERVDEGLRRLLNQLLAAHCGREVVRPRRELRRLRVPDDPAQNRLHRTGAFSQHVVVEVVGEVERCTSVLQRPRVSLPEAGCPREPAVDQRPERGARSDLTERLLEQRDGAIDAL